MAILVIDASGFIQGKTYGFNTYLVNLLEYFDKQRKEIEFDRILIACDNTQTDIFEKYQSMEVYGFDCGSYWKRFRVVQNLWKLLHLSSDDVILFPGNYSSLTKHCRYVLVIHDLLYFRKQFMPKNMKFVRWQRLLFVPRSIQLADKVIAISYWVKKDIEEHYPRLAKDKIEAVYNSFDFAKYGNNPSEGIIQLANSPYFLVVSADYPHKHVANVVEAFSRYTSQDSEMRLIIVGNMSEERRTQISALPNDISKRIQILRGISDDDLALLYQKAKAYINATEFEGLGMPLVEALYFGTKVVSSNIEIAREVTNGKAIYFNHSNVNELHHILCHLDEYAQPEDSQVVITDKFSAVNTSGRYVNILNEQAKHS